MNKKTSDNFITDFDCYLFGRGTHYELYKKLGVHKTEAGFNFAAWAPHAEAVSVVGDFNNWDASRDKCTRLGTSGIWTCSIEDAKPGNCYKFDITDTEGKHHLKADPYARQAELRPRTASVIAAETEEYNWNDEAWICARAKGDIRRKPMSIFECHPGSWIKPEFGGEFYNYREYAFALADYVLAMGYTHVELIGISEHPYDGSWGYQVTGYFAPTSRYGSGEDFAFLVDYLHSKNIGVILDWVPAHFPKDEHGLANFDGSPCYEYADTRKGEHPDWGTLVFDYSKTEVSNFLIASALFWLNEYHIDGLRVDAVASMLYLDYGRKDGEWLPNKEGGRENLEAIEFFRHLNSVIAGRKDGTMTIAEESTAWPKVTGSVRDGGLGFTFKWNMGWMHDFLEYMKLDPIFRKEAHYKMAFSLDYFTSENYVLVLSHDEVVHLKCSMINKMPGYPRDKFSNLKCAYAFMFGHPGKKLLFMGQEFGASHEWDEKTMLEWNLLENEENRELKNFYASLQKIYKKYPCLYQEDASWNGFEWVNKDDKDRSIFSFIRKTKNKRSKKLLFVVNFTPMERSDYMVGCPRGGEVRLILNENGLVRRGGIYQADEGECDGRPYRIKYPLAPYGIGVFEI